MPAVPLHLLPLLMLLPPHLTVEALALHLAPALNLVQELVQETVCAVIVFSECVCVDCVRGVCIECVCR